MPSLASDIEHLLATQPNDLELETDLQELARTRKTEFEQSDGAWALPLYERSLYIFGEFILANLSAQPQHRETVEALLRRAETDNQYELFASLYRWVYTPARWNADVRHWVETAPDFATIHRAIEFRRGDYQSRPTIEAEILTALYQRDPAQYVALFTFQDNASFKLPDTGMDQFRRLITDPVFSRILFQRYATTEEWHAEVRRLIAERPKDIAQKLENRHPHHIDPELPLHLRQDLITTFGDEVRPYLNKFSRAVVLRRVEEAISSEADNEQLLMKLNALHQEARQAFSQAANVWAPALYERNAEFFEQFILWHGNTSPSVMTTLLGRAKQDRRYDFYRRLYERNLKLIDWNAELRNILQSTDDLPSLLRELERIDIRRERRYGTIVRIDEQAAADLYRRGGSDVQEFIWSYLPNENRGYADLLNAIEETGNMDFFRRVFRKVASNSAWEQEMRNLLEQDIPPDRILTELEQRKPMSVTGVSPAILGEFMTKYGEAVLPFFENYLDWVTPKRMQALFALDIDRGALMRELQAIARRQPREFAERAELWLPQLYKLSPEFFATFITRHVNQWGSKKFIVEFLPRIEADGHHTLYRDLYILFYQGREWEQDIARLLRSGLNDAALHKALMQRTSRWQGLPDDLAAELYQRNPDLFRDYLLEHLRIPRWESRTYSKLQNAVEQRGDTAFRDAIQMQTSPHTVIKKRIEALIARTAPVDEVIQQLEQSKKADIDAIDSQDTFIKLVERYGDAVMPYINDYTQVYSWRRRNAEPLRQVVERYASKSSYWRFVFATRDAKRWLEALKQAAKIAPNEMAFRIELTHLTPDSEQFGQIDEETAVAMYRRFPTVSRPMLERMFKTYSDELFKLAEQNGDEDFLDYLTYQMLLAINPLIYRAYPTSSPRFPRQPDKKAQADIVEMGALADSRFERLYRESPQTYIGHASQILSFVNPFEIGGRWTGDNTSSTRNPIWAYLKTRYLDDWRRSPEGITALMESPNIFIQLQALDILAEGGEDAAARVVENLPVFRAFLLSRAHKKAKWQALACLESAGKTDEHAAARILPLLQEAMDYTSRRSVGDEIAVAYARLTQ